MVTNTRPAPPRKPPVAVCKSPGGQMTSQQYQLRQQQMSSPPARNPPPVDSYFDKMSPGDSMRIDKNLLDDNPSWKVSLLGSEFDVERHHSGDIFIRKRTMKEIQRAKEEGKKAVASEVPSEYRDLADIGSEMFDPLTCLKNGIPWGARAESKSEKKGKWDQHKPPQARVSEQAYKYFENTRQKTHSTGPR